MDAIRAAIQQAQTPSTLTAPSVAQPMASPVALISDNRNAERARPNGLRLASRWLKGIERHLAYASGMRLTLAVSSVETIDGATAKSQAAGAWLGALTVDDELAMVSVGGPVVEAIVARMLGDTTSKPSSTERPLSALSRRLFATSGQGIVTALCDAWLEELGITVKPAPSALAEPWRHGLGDGDTVLVITLVSQTPAGTFRLIARPDVLSGPDASHENSPAPTAAVEAALAAVPIDVRVELGRARLTMAELLALEPGAVITLDRLIDDPVPVLCAGVVKAHGKPLATRGGIAVEVVALEPSAEKL
jgi:flagellar motor switch protein FliN/FliY